MPKEKVLQVQRESKFDGLLPKPKLLHRIVHMSTNPHEAETLDFDLADRLVKSLRVSGVGVGDIAVELGVTRQTVANWTSGRTAPKRVYRKQWALFTGVPYEWLETGQKKDPQPKGPGVQELPDGFDPSTFSLQALRLARNVRPAAPEWPVIPLRRERDPWQPAPLRIAA